MKIFKGTAEKGKSTMVWYVGFNLHLLCNEKGEIINFVLKKANLDNRNENTIDTLTDKMFGKQYADKGYISQSLFGNPLVAMGAYCFFAVKPEVNFDFDMAPSNGQLVLWQ